MKYIQKAGAPHAYKAWCNRVSGTWEADYRELKNPEKADLHSHLLKEQGWLCAYTMQRVDLGGQIAAIGNHAAARKTIEVLALNHDSLIDARKRVIEEFIYGTDPLSPAKATQAKAIICQRSSDGRFHEFCVAIRDALDDYLKVLQKNARRRKFARRKN